MPGVNASAYLRFDGSSAAVCAVVAGGLYKSLDVMFIRIGRDLTCGTEYETASGVPSAEELQKLLETADYKKLQISGSTVAIPVDSMVDLGSVAKGYTGDRLIGHFRDNGITSAIVSLGGNVQTLGAKPDGSPWRVGIADPFGGEYAGALSVRDKCVITSGSYQRFFEENGVRYHHIIDPSTGSPASGGFVSVTVVGDKGVLCDALSTALFVMGKDRAFDFCASAGDFDALFIDEDGRIYITAGIADDFTPSGNYKNAGITVIGK